MEKKEEVIDPDLVIVKQIMEFILSKFEPAESFKDADVMLTTNELYNQVIALYPTNMLYEKHIFNALMNNHFKYDNIDYDLKFVWLLKEKKAPLLLI
jgi:hypothetical protein